MKSIRRNKRQLLWALLAMMFISLAAVKLGAWFATRNPNPFAEARLHVGASIDSVAEQLGTPTARQSGEGEETWEYRRGDYRLALTFRSRQLLSWREIGPYHWRSARAADPRSAECCD